MSFLDRLRRRSDHLDERGAVADASAEEVDPDTGEILRGSDADRAESPARALVAGERTIPSVNRERSMRSRISAALALGTFVLLSGGFLVWYYATYFAHANEERTVAARAAQARAGGESRVPPLGRVEPPAPATQVDTGTSTVTAADFLGPAPPVPDASNTMGSGTARSAKSPAELALERRLKEPVLMRPQQAPPAALQPPGPLPLSLPGAPNLAAIVGAMSGAPAGVDSAAPGGQPALGEMLKPTPTPAVTAQVLPTRRFLLPKGAFVDCTLETAIDSTLDGMVTCVGASDVYGADGKVVLLERGTKYVGEKRGELRQGQARVFVLWHEARTPGGVVVNLASPGTDALGRTGLPGHVERHFWQRFGAAILVSVIDGGMQALAASQQRGGGTAVSIGTQGTREVMTEVLKSTIAIPPTVFKNHGERVQVLVARDADFRGVYALHADDDGR